VLTAVRIDRNDDVIRSKSYICIEITFGHNKTHGAVVHISDSSFYPLRSLYITIVLFSVFLKI